MTRKLVSVITGTYNRPVLINKCIKEVDNQTYPNIEHCIASDGPDELLRMWHENGWPQSGRSGKVPIKFVEAGRHWSSFLANSISAVPYRMAQDMSSGDYLMWLADDENIIPEHIELLVNELEDKDVDFVYSRSDIWFNRDVGLMYGPNVIGEDPPRNGRITQALFRAELLDYRGFMCDVGSGTDWDQIDAWMKAGASWAFVNKVTHSHRVDKMGDANLNRTKQVLRGQLRESNRNSSN